ncbi:CGNR zinc finger domain-containing protein [Gloeobacter violaceus]|nr:ABATE domain-containing protein [Gloeobacter violaceus]
MPLFVADHLALDFLNSRAAPSGTPIEWLANGKDLLAWLQLAGLLDRETARRLAVEHPPEALDTVAGEARALREWLRGFVAGQAGGELGKQVLGELEPLNRLLAGEEAYRQIAWGEAGKPVCRIHRRWIHPQQLLQPVAEVMADLVCRVDFALVRHCEGTNCTLWFVDTTKSHSRRWCSMALCGNRAKAAAHRSRAKHPPGRTAGP